MKMIKFAVLFVVGGALMACEPIKLPEVFDVVPTDEIVTEGGNIIVVEEMEVDDYNEEGGEGPEYGSGSAGGSPLVGGS